MSAGVTHSNCNHNRKLKETTMKIKNAIFASLFAVALLTAAGIFAVNTGAQGPISASPRRSAAIVLQCRNYGGQQDVSKNPYIINSSKKTFAAGKKLYWSSSDADSGSVALEHSPDPEPK